VGLSRGIVGIPGHGRGGTRFITRKTIFPLGEAQDTIVAPRLPPGSVAHINTIYPIWRRASDRARRFFATVERRPRSG
jgi:hypothetical protein